MRPGLTIKSVIPDLVFAHGRGPRSAFCDGRLNGRYLVSSGASLRIYLRIAIWDSTRVPPARKALAFLGRGRLGILLHTAELKVSIPGRRPARAFGQYVRGHLVAADRERWRDTLIAIRAAKRLSVVGAARRSSAECHLIRPVRLGGNARRDPGKQSNKHVAKRIEKVLMLPSNAILDRE